MSAQLNEFLNKHEFSQHLLNEQQTRGFITAMAAAPHLINPNEWLAFLWGGDEQSPFDTHEQLESYANIIVDIWNHERKALLSGSWAWPEGCALDDMEIVNDATRDFSGGLLQGWSLARDDWETLMPEHSEESALLGGVILSISLLYDPETALAAMQEEGAGELAQFEEIFNAMPVMLSGLTLKGQQLAANE